MKALITTSTLFIALLLTHAGRAQVIERYAFKEATTIRLYVSDSTESAAIARFTDFINKTSWTVQTVAKRDEREQAGRSPALAQPTPQKTMQTDLGSLFDVMMGEFQGQLEFYADRDSSNKMYIAVSGYASTATWGGSPKSKMKKGGKNSHWTQRALFKKMDKHLYGYPGVNLRMYSDE